MKKINLSIVGLMFLLALISCGEDSGSGNENEQNDSTETVEVEGAVDTTKTDYSTRKGQTLKFVIQSPCDEEQPDLYCIMGLSYLRFGDDVVYAKLKIDGAEVKDTVYSDPAAPDSDWNVKEVRYSDGKVILESDWEKYQYLARVRIETPRLKNAHGIGVGSTLQDIADTYTILYVQPYPEENILEVYITETNPVPIFHIEMPEGMDTSGDNVPVHTLPGDLKVVRVVLWDKTVGNDA